MKLALVLIVLLGPDGQQIEINPAQIVTLRNPRSEGTNFAPGVKCLIHTADGKLVTVVNDCEEVREKLRQALK